MNLTKHLYFFSSKKQWIFLSLLMVFISSCQDVKMPERPDNLIPEDKIVKIYTDAYINNAAKNVNNKLLMESGVKLDSILYLKYKIDSLQFAKSNAYYSSDLSNYAALFMRVDIRLKSLQIRTDRLVLEAEIRAEEALCDSLLPKDSLQVNFIKVDTLLINPVKVDTTLITPSISD